MKQKRFYIKDRNLKGRNLSLDNILYQLTDPFSQKIGNEPLLLFKSRI